MLRRITLGGIISVAALLMFASGVIMAQAPVQVLRAELSVPFGMPAAGKIALYEDTFLFIDEEQLEGSFAIHRTNVKDMTFSPENLANVSTNQPVKDRSGLRSVFIFRVAAGTAALQAWRSAAPAQASGQPAVAATPAPGALDEEKAILTYTAQHDHFVGSCSGTLKVTENRLTFEAPKTADHSRQWQFRDIRVVKQQGPYVLEIEPYTEGKYKFQLLGTGMDVKDYEALVAKISAARAGK